MSNNNNKYKLNEWVVVCVTEKEKLQFFEVKKLINNKYKNDVDEEEVDEDDERKNAKMQLIFHQK